MSDLHPDTPPQSAAKTLSLRQWRTYLVSALPFIVTVVVSVALTLLVQVALPLPSGASLVPTTVVSLERSPMPASPMPTLTPPASASSLLSGAISSRDELIDLQHEISRLWSAHYLARAAHQIADAETALRVNDLDEVEQVLTTVDASLDRAYQRSAEQEKGPINEFRMQVNDIYENLHTRPQGVDQRLRRLRQSMLNLVDEGS